MPESPGPLASVSRVLLLVAVAFAAFAFPGNASGAVSNDASGTASWSCSFDASSGVLEMRAAASTKPVEGGVPVVPNASSDLVIGDACVGAGGTRYTDVREVRVHAPRTLLTFGIRVTEVLRDLGRPMRYTFEVPEDGRLLLGIGYPKVASSPTSAAAELTATATGLDYDGDGVQDVTVDAKVWNVSITAFGTGGTYDLREVPADPNDLVDHYFGSRAPVTFYGPRSGPDIRYHTSTLAAYGGTGPSGADRITTYGGDDTITSDKGDDVIDTGAGDDAVFAGGGADIIRLGAGNDWGYGVKDTPGLAGGAGYDRTWGGPSNDYIEGSWFAWGESGRDIITGCCALADGGPGTDFIWFGMKGKKSIVRCGTGVDYLAVGIGSLTAYWKAMIRRTGCERGWNDYRNADSPFQMAWRPAGGDGHRRQIKCGRLGYVFLCDPREPLPAAYGKCRPRSQC